MNKKIQVLYEDKEFIVINKPSGILSVGDRFNLNTPSLLGMLRKKYDEVYTVHRLDKETSGVIVYALTKAAHKSLSEQFENRTTEKKYIAFVENHIEEAGTIDAPIAESPFIKGKMVIHKKGKPSLTEYKRIEKYGNISLVDINLKTGRTHQIRVHFAHIGNPLFIDSLYGHRAEFYLSEIKGRKYKSGKYKVEKPLLSRLTLHAKKLTFNHPTINKVVSLKADLPKDLKALHYQLSKFYQNGSAK